MLNRKILSIMLPITKRLMAGHIGMPSSKVAFSFSKQSELEKITKRGKDLDDIIPEIKKPRDPDGGVHSVQRVLQKETMGEELKDRMEILRKRHELLRVELGKKVELPFILCGINRKTYHESFGYMPERVMSYYRIHPTTITDYLLKIYKATLYSIVDRNTSFMDEYWQAGFKEQVMKSLQTADQKGYKLKITEDKKFGQEQQESCRIADALMVRGVSIVRSENKHPSQYHKYAEDKQFGLVTYTPLYLTTDNERFSNPQSNKTVYQGYQKMIMRLLIVVRTPVRLTVPELQVPDELNTYQHLMVVQNEMVAPPHLESRYKLQTLVEWLGKYRFGQWRVVDLDNFMRGNSPFRLHQQEEQIEEIFKNTILDKSYYCNIRNL